MAQAVIDLRLLKTIFRTSLKSYWLAWAHSLSPNPKTIKTIDLLKEARTRWSIEIQTYHNDECMGFRFKTGFSNGFIYCVYEITESSDRYIITKLDFEKRCWKYLCTLPVELDVVYEIFAYNSMLLTLACWRKIFCYIEENGIILSSTVIWYDGRAEYYTIPANVCCINQSWCTSFGLQWVLVEIIFSNSSYRPY